MTCRGGDVPRDRPIDTRMQIFVVPVNALTMRAVRSNLQRFAAPNARVAELADALG